MLAPIQNQVTCQSAGSNRICNPDAILPSRAIDSIQQEIDRLQKSRVTCNGQVAPLQMGVYMEEHMSGPSRARVAQTPIHNSNPMRRHGASSLFGH